MRQLAEAADRFDVLARCLAVTPQLQAWRLTGEALSGTDAANALDQAVGDLERLASGDATKIAEGVQSVLTELPPSWD